MTTYKRALILLHGSGGDGISLSKDINFLYPNFFSLLETANIKVILPTSAIRPYSLLNGEKIRVWHDRNSLSCDSIEDKEGLIRTGNSIKKIISDLWTTDKIDISNIIIGGFSMGGGVALHFALSEWYDFQAVICVSSYVTTKSDIWTKNENTLISYKIDPKILMIHGEEDLLIPIEWSQKTRDLLILKNYDVNWFKYKGVKHELSFSILDYIVKYVIDIL